MSVSLVPNLGPEALAFIQYLAEKRDSLPVYSRAPVQRHLSLSPSQIWGRIFSFLSSDAKQAVALTCRRFYRFLKEEDERYVQAIIGFISDNYVILDTNIDFSLLETAIKKGILFLLGDVHNKPSQMLVHEAFMSLALTPETRYLTEGWPRSVTRNQQILSQAESWDIRTTIVQFVSKKLDAAPSSLPVGLKRVLQNTHINRTDIPIALTLFYLYLVEEENCQNFIQAVLFFYNFFNVSKPEDWPSDKFMQGLSSGQIIPHNFGDIKLSFLKVIYDACSEIDDRISDYIDKLEGDNHHEQRNDDLIEKIEKIFAQKKPVKTGNWPGASVIVQGGSSHFHDDGGIGVFLAIGKRREKPLCSTITPRLSEKNIPYIVLYPKEPLISRHTLNAQVGTDEYKKFMMFYHGVVVALAQKKGKHQETLIDRFNYFFSKTELTQEFLDFLANEKKDKKYFAWNLAGVIVRMNALETYIANQSVNL